MEAIAKGNDDADCRVCHDSGNPTLTSAEIVAHHNAGHQQVADAALEAALVGQYGAAAQSLDDFIHNGSALVAAAPQENPFKQ